MSNKRQPSRFLPLLLLPCLLFAEIVAASTCNPHLQRWKPNSIYADYRDGTIMDMQTGLMWQACSVGQQYRDGQCRGEPQKHNYPVVVEAAATANHGNGSYGYTDWRLPSIAELGTLVEKACHSPAINSEVFPSTGAGWYWSVTVYAVKDRMAWGVDFAVGRSMARERESQGYIRLVRYARSER